MSQRELTRLEVIQRVKRKTLKQRQAAELLSVSVRHQEDRNAPQETEFSDSNCEEWSPIYRNTSQ